MVKLQMSAQLPWLCQPWLSHELLPLSLEVELLKLLKKCLWSKSVVCSTCGHLGDASEPCSSMNWRRNVEGFPFIAYLCFWWLNLLLCSSRIFSSAHTVSSVKAVLFGTGSQELGKKKKKSLLTRETRKSATIFTVLILKTNLHLQK